MEFRDLEYFLACLDAGSLTRATSRVHVAQPTLSHAIARLEQELGEQLLLRAPNRPVVATDSGALLATHARECVDALRRFHERLSELRGGLTGSVRIAAIPSASTTLLPRALFALSRSHPGIELSVRTLSAEKIAGAVARGRDQLGVVAGPASSNAALDTRLLYRERFVAVLRRDDPLARRRTLPLSALAERPLLLSPAGTVTSDLVLDACRSAGMTPTVRITLASAEALRETARQGLGPAILPAGLVAASDPDLVELPLVAPELLRDIWLVQRRGAEGRAIAVVAEAIFAAVVARGRLRRQGASKRK